MSDSTISRRQLLKYGGLAAAGLAASGALSACSAAGSDAADVSTSTTTGSNWKKEPAEITNFVKEYDFDVVCVGHGYSGLCSCRELAEQGRKVALIEKQAEDKYAATGNESASFNSKLLDRLGIPHIDPIEYFQNWMAITGNYANPELVMKFCQNCGDTADWYYSELTEQDLATMTSQAWPDSPHRLPQVGPFKFWPGTASFYDPSCKQTKIQGYNREAAKAKGAEFFFETEAQYLVMENGAVKGLVATSPEGNVKFNCKAVVVATGGFNQNEEMFKDLCPDFYGNFVGDEALSQKEGNPNAFGRGIQMAYWAGARLETQPVPTMNGKHIDPPAGMINLPQTVWLDSNGERFCNEYYPVTEHRCLQTVYRERQKFFCVFDSDILTYLTYSVPQHGTFNPSQPNLAGVEDQMRIAREKFQGTYKEPESSGEAPMIMVPVAFCDDTLEGLAAQCGLKGEAATAFVESVNRYNSFVDSGVDTDYGRYKETLFPVKKPPFYVSLGEPHLGKIMVTVGGVITDGEQNALDKDFKPIPGLYVSGNDCGRRFGIEYFTPTPGVSLGIAITLGRECGRSVNAFLSA